MENQNKWSVYIGVAVEDRIYNSKFIKVYCHEILPFIDGKLEDLTVKDLIKITNDLTQSEEEIEVESTNIITAQYLDMFFNFSFPPFIRKGQRVLVLRYMDQDKYYWIPLGMDKHLNKKEVIRIFASNKEDSELPNDDNSYFIEIDTLFRKHIIIKTSKSDNEQFKYTIHIDSKNNRVTLNDDDGREIFLDSNSDTISFKNKAGTHVSIEKDKLFGYAPLDVNLKAGRNFTAQAKEVITFDAPRIDWNKG